jgi:hypothetical protein
MSTFLEAAMLGAFSISWYCSIWKMLRTRQAAGKSLGFVLLICFGYVFGIASKLTVYWDTGIWSAVILLYVSNLLVTGFDAYLVMRFGRLARHQAAAASRFGVSVPGQWSFGRRR